MDSAFVKGWPLIIVPIVISCAHGSTPAGVTGASSMPVASSVPGIAPPPASSKSLTQSCRPHLDWSWDYMPDESCRDRGLWCHDQTSAVTFPVCEQEVLDSVVPHEVYLRSQGMFDFIAQRGSRKFIALRGYMRRDRHKFQVVRNKPATPVPPGGGCPMDTDWDIRLERQSSDGSCQEAMLGSAVLAKGDGLGTRGTSMCWGDGTIACCANNLVDSDEEVVAYWSDQLLMPRWCTTRSVPFEQQKTYHRGSDETPYDKSSKGK